MSEGFDPFVAEWITFASSPNYNRVEKCLKFAQILEYPGLRIDGYIEKVRQMGLSLRETACGSGAGNPIYRISMLNEHLFGAMGFAGDEDDYYDPRNNFLNEVIDRRRGLPVTMSVLYAEVAKFAGLDLRIVGFPSHVLVKYGEEIVLDPFHGGRRLDPDDLQGILDVNYGQRLEMRPEFLDEIGTGQVIVRMARNLKNSYMHSFAYDRALRCVDMILAMEPESAEEIRDKGVLKGRMLEPEAALRHLGRYLDMCPNADDVDAVLDLIGNIRASNGAKSPKG